MAVKIIERFASKCPCWTTNLAQQGLAPTDPKADSRYQQYYSLFKAGKIKLMLHSLGCPRASADYQADKWNSPSNDAGVCHAVVDSNDGYTRQTLRWDMRGWHCGGSGNNTHIGVEMCESDQIRYTSGAKFEILNKSKAQAHCRTAYNGAVELFAFLCIKFGCDPLKDICSHKEGGKAGIASGHVDPEHYWTGLGMPYTMDTFRAAVKAKVDAETAADPTPTPQPENPPTGFLGFPDVPEDAWYADALKWAVEKKIIKPSGKPFKPDAPLTKASAIVLLRRLYNALKN